MQSVPLGEMKMELDIRVIGTLLNLVNYNLSKSKKRHSGTRKVNQFYVQFPKK